MDANVQIRIQRTLSCVVEMLVRKDYAGLESLTNGIRLNAEHIEAGVVDYGRTLVDPPHELYEDIDVIEIEGTTPTAYSVRFRLCTREEGRSDLELQATLIDEDPSRKLMRVEIDGILVP